MHPLGKIGNREKWPQNTLISWNYVFVPTSRCTWCFPPQNLPIYDVWMHLWCPSNITSSPYDLVSPQIIYTLMLLHISMNIPHTHWLLVPYFIVLYQFSLCLQFLYYFFYILYLILCSLILIIVVLNNNFICTIYPRFIIYFSLDGNF